MALQAPFEYCSLSSLGEVRPSPSQTLSGRTGGCGGSSSSRTRSRGVIKLSASAPTAGAVGSSCCSGSSSSSSSSLHGHIHRAALVLGTTTCSSAGPPTVQQCRVLSADKAITESEPSAVSLTHLESNSWLWEVGGVRILIDPILEGTLDFGIPLLYEARKKVLKDISVRSVLAQGVDVVLITQSLDDHCHMKTLRVLAQLQPDIPIIATPNAEPLLSGLFTKVTYLEPGTTTTASGSTGAAVSVRATKGPVLGPPWQRPENGYIVRSEAADVSVYLEPHCQYDEDDLADVKVDVVVTPVVKQLLPAYTLVSGQEDAARLASLVKARYLVALPNADVDSRGILNVIVQEEGTFESFKAILRENNLDDLEAIYPRPGEPVHIASASSLVDAK